MDEESKRVVREGLLDAVDVQVRAGEPPETGAALDRLIEEGYSNQDARKLIGQVLAAEMFEIVRQQRVFDPQKYGRALEALPHSVYGEDEADA